MDTIIAATRDDGDAKEYLRRNCVVSAVAVSFRVVVLTGALS